MDRAKVNGVELEYEVRGAGEPVLLIDMLIADCFVPLLAEPALADRYQLIRYHKRGWVGSTHTPPPVSIGDHAADAAALLEHLGVRRAHIAGHSTGASIGAQLALDHPEKVHTLTLLEPTLVSLPLGGAFLKAAGPVFEAYGSGDHSGAFAMFVAAASGLDWEACRALLEERIPGVVAQSIKDADTFFGVELPAVAELDVRARAGCRHSQTSPLRDRRGDPAAVGGDRRVPPLLAPARRGVHDRRGGPSPADPTSRARRPSDGGVPGAKLHGRRPGSRVATGGAHGGHHFRTHDPSRAGSTPTRPMAQHSRLTATRCAPNGSPRHIRQPAAAQATNRGTMSEAVVPEHAAAEVA